MQIPTASKRDWELSTFDAEYRLRWMDSASDSDGYWYDWRIWGILFLIHLPPLIIPYIYWRFRHVDPIKNRRPRLLFACCIALSVLALHQVSRNLFQSTLPAWWDVILGPALVFIVIESFLIFSISLYIAFNKTQDQLKLSTNAGYTIIEFEQTRQSIARKNLLLTDSFALIWIAANVFLVQAMILIYASIVDISALTLSIESIRGGWPLPYCRYIIVGRMMITVVMFVALSFKLRIVEDAFGTKRLLRYVGMGAAVGAVLYIVVGKSVPQLAVILTCDGIMIQTFVLPIRRIQQHGSRTRDQTGSNPGSSQFERFLQTEAGFSAFRLQLEKEFAVESLLFWRDVQRFQHEFPGMADGGHAAALAICERYLSPYAPLEINLSGQAKASIMSQVQDGVLHADLFDQAAKHILALMESNSLLRFMRATPPAWEHFLVQDRANFLMSDQGTEESHAERPSFGLESATKLSIVMPKPSKTSYISFKG